eukprot:356401-Chlamydomonas_euryale.AAC.3
MDARSAQFVLQENRLGTLYGYPLTAGTACQWAAAPRPGGWCSVRLMLISMIMRLLSHRAIGVPTAAQPSKSVFPCRFHPVSVLSDHLDARPSMHHHWYRSGTSDRRVERRACGLQLCPLRRPHHQSDSGPLECTTGTHRCRGAAQRTCRVHWLPAHWCSALVTLHRAPTPTGLGLRSSSARDLLEEALDDPRGNRWSARAVTRRCREAARLLRARPCARQSSGGGQHALPDVLQRHGPS